MPFPEAVLRGSRRIVFQPIFLAILILFYFKIIKLNWKNTIYLTIVTTLLFSLATIILIKRESVKDKDVYLHLIKNARYNDLLKPKEKIIKYIKDNKKSDFSKSVIISSMQIGQYYTHGIFEFNYILKYYKNKKFEKQLGKFTFFVIPKFINKIGIYNVNVNNKISPREYTFISFFGGMYLDFGWFALVFMFALGAIQKIIFVQVKSNNIYFLPIFIFLIFINFFMLTFNFYRGTGTYTLMSCLLFALTFSYKRNLFRSKF
ncbi:MAG: hypothetical protein L3J23_02875 [Flavobacteriaceae bacterium]|nr:hypothetical protein [Flavobacteriaceae bacterium]